jgi:predicted metal-binding membrane protein
MRYARQRSNVRMTEVAGHKLDHLSPAAGRLGAAFARPKVIAVACVVALAGLGWFTLGLQAANTSMIDALCRAMVDGTTSATGIALVAAMWGAMTLAMMLPSTAPMILTYAEIADTAAGKNEPVVSPFMIAAGYTVVWLGFAATATLAQLALMRATLLDPSMASASGLFSGAIFIGAGVYQFSALKHACLTQCQHPFPFFFANWATTPRGVFKLGVRQGLFCLGCCWAMMLVMFAVGIMNVVWMAALGIVMTIEKIGTGKKFTYAIGVALIAIGVGLVGLAVAAHWPGRVI